MVTSELRMWNISNGSDDLPFDMCLPTGFHHRLEGYQLMARRENLQDLHDRWACRACVAWLNQNSFFTRKVVIDKLGAFLKATFFWELVRERPLLVPEMWVVRGFPFPGPH